MPQHDCIEITRDTRGVACVTVANAAKLNTLSRAVMTALIDAVEALAGEPSLRAVILRGAGARAFIGGADITEMATLNASSARDFITMIHRSCDVFRRLPVPVIARIQGYVLGAGLEVAVTAGEETRGAWPSSAGHPRSPSPIAAAAPPARSSKAAALSSQTARTARRRIEREAIGAVDRRTGASASSSASAFGALPAADAADATDALEARASTSATRPKGARATWVASISSLKSARSCRSNRHVAHRSRCACRRARSTSSSSPSESRSSSSSG